MPRGDGTGPVGMGPMTGRAAGYCAGNTVSGYMNPVMGRGMGYGSGRGRGMRSAHGWFGRGGMYNCSPAFFPAPAKEQETEMLKAQARGLEETLKEIQHRISELETESVGKEK